MNNINIHNIRELAVSTASELGVRAYSLGLTRTDLKERCDSISVGLPCDIAEEMTKATFEGYDCANRQQAEAN